MKANLSKASRDLGKSESYLACIRASNKEKWEKMISFDKDVAKSVFKYIEYVEDLKNELQELYYEDEQARAIMLSFYSQDHFHSNRDQGLSAMLFNNIEPLSTGNRTIRKMEKMKESIRYERSRNI